MSAILGAGEHVVGFMGMEYPGALASDVAVCRYGGAALNFRGPERAFETPFVACLGGSDMFGRFVRMPFPDLVESELGWPCINFGCVNAGVDAFLSESDLLNRAATAAVTVVQVLPAQNLSNAYYRVHPRRNDRFLAACPMLRDLYPEADLTEVSFNRHLLAHLHGLDPARFALVRDALQHTWSARMATLLDRLGPNVVLLCLRKDQPGTAVGAFPGLVTTTMVEDLAPRVAQVIDLRFEPAGDAGDMRGMRYRASDEPAAAQALGPKAHGAVAQALAPVLRACLKQKTPQRGPLRGNKSGTGGGAQPSLSVSSGTASKRSATRP